MEGTDLLSNAHETCHGVFELRVWQNHTFSEHPEGVTVIALLAGIVPSRQAVWLQTLTQRSSGPVMLHKSWNVMACNKSKGNRAETSWHESCAEATAAAFSMCAPCHASAAFTRAK